MAVRAARIIRPLFIFELTRATHSMRLSRRRAARPLTLLEYDDFMGKRQWKRRRRRSACADGVWEKCVVYAYVFYERLLIIARGLEAMDFLILYSSIVPTISFLFFFRRSSYIGNSNRGLHLFSLENNAPVLMHY